MAKRRLWEISVRPVGESFRSENWKTLQFFADTKQRAFDHAKALRDDPFFRTRFGQPMITTINEPIRQLAVRFVGWEEPAMGRTNRNEKWNMET